MWAAGYGENARPLRRAACHDGYFPIELAHPDQVAGMAATLAGLRGEASRPFDIAVALAPGTDPAPWAAAGATWWMTDFEPATLSLDLVRGVLRDGPPTP